MCGAATGGSRGSLLRCRSIPTCAGQPLAIATPIRTIGGLSPRVRSQPIVGGFCRGLSPRVRGSPTVRLVHKGLSPRVRGRSKTFSILRSIPTCAGQPSLLGVLRELLRGLSPRVRGSLLPRYGFRLADTGLSPRVRGSPAVCQARRCQDAVYPHVCGAAYPTPLRQVMPVYPHVCGAAEYALSMSDTTVYPHVCGAAHADLQLCSTRIH